MSTGQGQTTTGSGPGSVSKREAILATLATRLNAHRAPWPELLLDTESPYTLLTDGEETVTGQDYDDALISLAVGVRRTTLAATDASRASTANALLAELIPATFGTDRTLGGACEGMRYDSGSTDYPTDGTLLVGAVALFAIDYRHAGGSPY